MLEKVAPKGSAQGQMRWSWGRLAVGGAAQMLVIAALFLRVRLPPSGRQIPFVRLGSLSWLSVRASTTVSTKTSNVTLNVLIFIIFDGAVALFHCSSRLTCCSKWLDVKCLRNTDQTGFTGAGSAQL